ncbi:MAG TPA: 50S ribosomal protein L15 [bacterium]|nr:50S ribosomal protein L15 [bacterium]
MKLNELKHAKGAKKSGKRLGRGPGTGTGKTAGKGHKGQKARSGAKHRPWFEGGQMPLQRRVPKRGFFNRFRKEYQIVNIGELEGLKNSSITPDDLVKARVIRNTRVPLKILGGGDIQRPIEVHAHAFSKQAREKLEAAGGKAIQL